ncbi:MAG: hypothetical protein KDE58_35460, partial [Caldilineaceae bacterium]|nr:hypothetical protein [Caldilineaceae bacterium]
MSAFQDGVCFVSLASIREAHLVLPAIAQTLDVREGANTTVAQSLQAHLYDKQLLLVLDNFEQVLDAAPRVGELLMACAQLKVLVTSRAALQVRGEQEFPVPVLALPDRKQVASPKSLAQFATVDLFIQRAQAVNPAFRLTEANAAAVAEICQRLDGLPLAIELAAASSKILPAPVILARLAERFELLRSSARDAPDRQRTLHASIGWSYDLLAPEEQRLFRRLSVFRGSFNLDAAEALCTAATPCALPVLTGISSLVDKSLLKPHPEVETEPRFVMLETIREFGLKQLAETGEAAEMQQAYAAYFYKLVQQAERQLWGAEIAAWVQRLDMEIDNLRAALTYYMDSAQGAEQRLQLAGSLWRFWEIRGYSLEGRTWLTKALDQDPDDYPLSRWLTLHAAGNLASDHGDYAVARKYYDESLKLLQNLLPHLPDPADVRNARYGLANT